jgi:hypothetical protein
MKYFSLRNKNIWESQYRTVIWNKQCAMIIVNLKKCVNNFFIVQFCSYGLFRYFQKGLIKYCMETTLHVQEHVQGDVTINSQPLRVSTIGFYE